MAYSNITKKTTTILTTLLLAFLLGPATLAAAEEKAQEPTIDQLKKENAQLKESVDYLKDRYLNLIQAYQDVSNEKIAEHERVQSLQFANVVARELQEYITALKDENAFKRKELEKTKEVYTAKIVQTQQRDLKQANGINEMYQKKKNLQSQITQSKALLQALENLIDTQGQQLKLATNLKVVQEKEENLPDIIERIQSKLENLADAWYKEKEKLTWDKNTTIDYCETIRKEAYEQKKENENCEKKNNEIIEELKMVKEENGARESTIIALSLQGDEYINEIKNKKKIIDEKQEEINKQKIELNELNTSLQHLSTLLKQLTTEWEKENDLKKQSLKEKTSAWNIEKLKSENQIKALNKIKDELKRKLLEAQNPNNAKINRKRHINEEKNQPFDTNQELIEENNLLRHLLTTLTKKFDGIKNPDEDTSNQITALCERCESEQDEDEKYQEQKPELLIDIVGKSSGSISFGYELSLQQNDNTYQTIIDRLYDLNNKLEKSLPNKARKSKRDIGNNDFSEEKAEVDSQHPTSHNGSSSVSSSHTKIEDENSSLGHVPDEAIVDNDQESYSEINFDNIDQQVFDVLDSIEENIDKLLHLEALHKQLDNEKVASQNQIKEKDNTINTLRQQLQDEEAKPSSLLQGWETILLAGAALTIATLLVLLLTKKGPTQDEAPIYYLQPPAASEPTVYIYYHETLAVG